MFKIREQLLEIAETRKIKITGLEEVPYILQARPLFDYDDSDPEILKKLGLTPEDLFQANGHFNTAVFPDGRVEGLRVMSDQYKLVQHDEMILGIMKNVPENLGVHSVDISTTQNGGQCYAKFKTNKSSEIIPGDIIEFRISGTNSADGSKLLGLRQGAYREWCSNGAMAPDSRFNSLRSRKLHKNGLELDNEIFKFVESLESAQEILDGWKKYATVKLDAPKLEGLFKSLEVGPRVQEELMATELQGDETTPGKLLENKNLTAWNMYNGFTQRITHSKSDEGVKMLKGLQVSELFEKLVNK